MKAFVITHNNVPIRAKSTRQKARNALKTMTQHYTAREEFKPEKPALFGVRGRHLYQPNQPLYEYLIYEVVIEDLVDD